jgi:hypothetical protein
MLDGKHKGKRKLVRPRHVWKDNIKVKLTEIECENLN